MIRSMTAFGRAVVETSLGQWVVEIHSVNRKMLDISVFIPSEFLRFDVEIRKWISESISRGQVNVKVKPPSQNSSKTSVEALKGLKGFWDQAALDLGFDPARAISLDFLVDQLRLNPVTLFSEEESQSRDAIKRGVEIALKELQQMKETEGLALFKDLCQRLKFIRETLTLLSSRAPQASIRGREKLEEKLKELPLDKGDIEARVLQEVIVLAEKTDVTEELIRLGSHLEQFENQLNSRESIGRSLDFLIQEMNREINTVASKAADLEVTKYALSIKTELEKIREQVQNIE